jgi:hypothetical protein
MLLIFLLIYMRIREMLLIFLLIYTWKGEMLKIAKNLCERGKCYNILIAAISNYPYCYKHEFPPYIIYTITYHLSI